MSANYIAETDFLSEAGDILAGRTRKLPTLEHLQALEALISVAYQFLAPELADSDSHALNQMAVADWLREAAKIK